MPRPKLHPALERAPRHIRNEMNRCKPARVVDARGYPRVKVRGKNCYAHRVAFEFFWRRLEPGERVYRACGRRDCVNYFHLTTTPPEREGKRHRPGTTKLTASKVRDVRRAYEEPGGPTQAELAREYGVSRSCISCVVRRVTWRGV